MEVSHLTICLLDLALLVGARVGRMRDDSHLPFCFMFLGGKSAILTAITVCLGGKATFTNRASSVKTLLKSGTE